MSYQALYRQYRPRCFGDVIGQSHITVILKNQVQSARASHAYLFCGSRGTGKTSTAKIFARAINCISPKDGEACGVCDSCRLMESETVDIIEIDAASNNGVDDVRALIDQARFTPLSLKYKVYIIDEVHMLSGAASNALLKTLEEPPAHVIFLLATTEPQKILATVISRCQRFDFKRINLSDIVDTLRDILSKIGASIEEEGLLAIARAADGGMRDALSLMDQCLAFCGNDISAKEIYDVLGYTDSDFLFDMTDALISSRPDNALRLLDDIVRSGRDLMVFSSDLMQHIRAVLLSKECGDCTELLDCTHENMRRYRSQAEGASADRLLRAIERLTRTQNEMKWLGRPRILLETALIGICRPEDELTIAALTDRVERLEAAIREGAYAKPSQEKPGKKTIDKASFAREDVEDDAPPWAESASVPTTQKAPAKKAETVKAAPASDAANVWGKLRKSIQKLNPALYVVSAGVNRSECQNNELILFFPESKKSAYDMLNRSHAQILEALKGINPELGLVFRMEGSGEPSREPAFVRSAQKAIDTAPQPQEEPPKMSEPAPAADEGNVDEKEASAHEVEGMQDAHTLELIDIFGEKLIVK